MRIEDSAGRVINTLDDWAAIYANPQQSHQWKEYRSAYSVADFVLNRDGGIAIRQRAAQALDEAVNLELLVPEYEQRFDRYGRGRVHDLGVFGSTENGRRLFMGVEAKVDEPFGATALDSYLLAKSKQITGTSTNAPQRIEELLKLHFSAPDPGMFDVRYQLLYATAGTLAADADVHILYVVVFETPLYDENLGAENHRDYMQFMEKTGATPLSFPAEEIIGHRLQLNDRELICLYEHVDMRP